jgi:hypothetical protein
MFFSFKTPCFLPKHISSLFKTRTFPFNTHFQWCLFLYQFRFPSICPVQYIQFVASKCPVDASYAKCRLCLWSSREATLKALLTPLCSVVRTEGHVELVIIPWFGFGCHSTQISALRQNIMMKILCFFSVAPWKFRVRACTVQSLCYFGV